MKSIMVGNAPCSWGTLEFADTQTDRLDCARVLDELAATGYTGCELGDWGFMPTDPESLASLYSERRLSLTGAFVPVALRDESAHNSGLNRCLEVASLLRDTSALLSDGTEPFLVLADDNGIDSVRTKHAGSVEPSMGLSPQEWQVFTSGADLIARAVNEQTGLRTVFHHHCAGFVETPGEIDTFLDGTNPAYIGLVFDTGHYAYGAGGCNDVLDAMERYSSRIWYVHFKDFLPEVLDDARLHGWDYFEAVGNGVFCELGDGCVDFPAVLAWLQRREYNGFITVEQDVLPGMGTPKESARLGREYLKSIGL